MAPTRPRVASPTIAETLAEFLRDQEKRLTPRTFANYRNIVDLFQHCLNGYAYQSLTKSEAKLFDRLFNAKGREHREFCQIFGPEHILPNVGGFLGYFMIRKVVAGKDLMRAAGTVTKKLARWLAQKDYASAEDAMDAADRGASAARDLPEARALATALSTFAERQERVERGGEIEDYFSITRLEPGKMWVEGMAGREVGPIRLPEELRRRCKVGWTISGAMRRVRGGWLLVEVWNVYPD